MTASNTVSGSLLPTWAVQLRQRLPDLALRVPPGSSENVIDAVALGEADLGVVEGPSVPRTVRSRTVHHDELVVVAPAGHPRARWRRGIGRDELSLVRMVMREADSGTWRHFKEALPGHARPLQTLNSNAGVRNAARAPGAPAALSLLAVTEDLRAGRLVRIPVSELRTPRTLRVIWHPNQRPRAAAELLRLATLGDQVRPR